MDSLVVMVNDLKTGAQRRYAFIKSPVSIGRSTLNDVPLPVPYVSSCHGLLQFDESEVRYIDLRSLNGSALDGSPLQPNVPALVATDSEICIGDLRLRCSRTAAPEATPREPTHTEFSRNVSQLNLAAQSAPPPAAAVETVAPAQVEVVEQALANAGIELDLQYASYRGTWTQLRSAIDQLLVGVEGPARALLLSRLAEKYEGLAREPEFCALSGGPQPAPALAGSGAASGFLMAFAQSYLPSTEQVATPEGADKLLARIAEVLEAFSKSYVELRKGREEFGREMGVAVRTEGAVERARDPQQLLGYLLDLAAEGRSAELVSAFGDLMLHQVALLNGVVEGARGLLARLDPEAVSAGSSQTVWPLKAGAQWKAYESSWHELVDDADGISDVLFGAEFARAYTAIVGQHAGEKNGSPKVAVPPSRPASPGAPQPRRR